MKPDDANVSGLFSQQIVQYLIPHYQRPQAWVADKHWEPLWADIESKADDWLTGVEPRQHYLGAIVMSKRPKEGVRGIDRYLVIDGQQRLSTLQYVLKALFLVCKEQGYEDGAASILNELFNANENMMDVPDVQRHKLWPTFRDRDAHRNVMMCTTIGEVRNAFSAHFTRAGSLAVYGKHPRPLHATWFFYQKLREWLEQLPEEDRASAGPEAARKAVTKSLQLIILWLESHDDPQVIFECLNGRGEPLRPTDLIKNYVFMSAEQPQPGGIRIEVSEESPLFKSWSQFDAPLWQEEVSRGRLKKPRLEWLVYYGLQAEMASDLDSSRTYQAFQLWASPSGTRRPAEEQVQMLLQHAENLQAFIAATNTTPIGRFARIASAVDVTIISPLALAIAKNCDPDTQEAMYRGLASYLVRREVCGLTKKAYNQIFFGLLRDLNKQGFTPTVLEDSMLALHGNTSSAWPTDSAFAESLQRRSIYSMLDVTRLLLASAANEIAKRPGAETAWAPEWSTLHVEHLLPVSWYEHWPLPDGSTVSEEDAIGTAQITEKTSDLYARAELIRCRQSLKNTLGNLTVLNAGLNMQIKNYPWEIKRQAIRDATQLRMNFDLADESEWREDQIAQRGKDLSDILVAAWPRRVSPHSN